MASSIKVDIEAQLLGGAKAGKELQAALGAIDLTLPVNFKVDSVNLKKKIAEVYAEAAKSEALQPRIAAAYNTAISSVSDPAQSRALTAARDRDLRTLVTHTKQLENAATRAQAANNSLSKVAGNIISGPSTAVEKRMAIATQATDNFTTSIKKLGLAAKTHAGSITTLPEYAIAAKMAADLQKQENFDKNLIERIRNRKSKASEQEYNDLVKQQKRIAKTTETGQNEIARLTITGNQKMTQAAAQAATSGFHGGNISTVSNILGTIESNTRGPGRSKLNLSELENLQRQLKTYGGNMGGTEALAAELGGHANIAPFLLNKAQQEAALAQQIAARNRFDKLSPWGKAFSTMTGNNPTGKESFLEKINPYGRGNDSLFNEMNKRTTNISQLAGVSLAGMGMVGGLVKFTQASVEAAAKAQQLKIILGGIINTFVKFEDGSGKAASGNDNFVLSMRKSQSVYEELRKRAAPSILTFPELADYFQSGGSAFMSKGLNIHQSMDLVTDMSQVGKAFDLAPKSIRADLRQMASGNINSQNRLAASMGITGAEDRAASAKGPEELFKFLEKKFAGMVPALKLISESFNAKWSEFLSNIQQVAIKIGTVLMPTVEKFMGNFTSLVDNWVASGKMQSFAESIGNTMLIIGNSFMHFLEMMQPFMGSLSGLLLVGFVGVMSTFVAKMLVEKVMLGSVTGGIVTAIVALVAGIVIAYREAREARVQGVDMVGQTLSDNANKTPLQRKADMLGAYSKYEDPIAAISNVRQAENLAVQAKSFTRDYDKVAKSFLAIKREAAAKGINWDDIKGDVYQTGSGDAGAMHGTLPEWLTNYVDGVHFDASSPSLLSVSEHKLTSQEFVNNMRKSNVGGILNNDAFMKQLRDNPEHVKRLLQYSEGGTNFPEMHAGEQMFGEVLPALRKAGLLSPGRVNIDQYKAAVSSPKGAAIYKAAYDKLTKEEGIYETSQVAPSSDKVTGTSGVSRLAITPDLRGDYIREGHAERAISAAQFALDQAKFKTSITQYTQPSDQLMDLKTQMALTNNVFNMKDAKLKADYDLHMAGIKSYEDFAHKGGKEMRPDQIAKWHLENVNSLQDASNKRVEYSQNLDTALGKNKEERLKANQELLKSINDTTKAQLEYVNNLRALQGAVAVAEYKWRNTNGGFASQITGNNFETASTIAKITGDPKNHVGGILTGPLTPEAQLQVTQATQQGRQSNYGVWGEVVKAAGEYNKRVNQGNTDIATQAIRKYNQNDMIGVYGIDQQIKQNQVHLDELDRKIDKGGPDLQYNISQRPILERAGASLELRKNALDQKRQSSWSEFQDTYTGTGDPYRNFNFGFTGEEGDMANRNIQLQDQYKANSVSAQMAALWTGTDPNVLLDKMNRSSLLDSGTSEKISTQEEYQKQFLGGLSQAAQGLGKNKNDYMGQLASGYKPDMLKNVLTLIGGRHGANTTYDDLGEGTFHPSTAGAWDASLGNVAGNFGANIIAQKMGGYSSEGSSIGGMLAGSGALASLGAWAGPVGMIGGALLGGLFHKSQPDPAIEAHNKRIEELLSRIDKSLRPVGDYFKQINGQVLYGSASRYYGERTNSYLGMQVAVGSR